MTATVEPAGFVRSADGTQLAYWRFGGGPPIVIVHGGLGSAMGWRTVAARLAEHFDVFVYDRRGRAAAGTAMDRARSSARSRTLRSCSPGPGRGPRSDRTPWRRDRP